MAQRIDVPFNVSILELTTKRLFGIRPITSLDIFDNTGINFHENGLWSVSIFGRVGDENRSKRFSYIDIKVDIFHPIIYWALGKLKSLYHDIMRGAEYAVWNPEIKDFERSTSILGRTGFSFFVEHWRDIEFKETGSDEREHNIKLILAYKDKAMTNKVIVMPAGLRDVEEVNGRYQYDEINGFYRKILAISNTISEASIKHNPETINVARYQLQNQFNQIYDLIEKMIQGKGKLLMGKWATRRIQNGTRNVASSMDTAVPYLGGKGTVDFNSTIIGLYQALRAASPISRYWIRNTYLSRIFRSVDMPVRLVNKQTLHYEDVQLKTVYYDRFATDEGMDKIITAFGEEGLRHKPIEIEGRWLGLIYKSPDKKFYRFIQDISELPESLDKKDVSPITFCEFLYLSVFDHIDGLPGFVTRYPITGIGSIYPSHTLIKPTISVEQRTELDEFWKPTEKTAYNFPVRDVAFINTIIAHSAHAGGLGLDYDGDTLSYTITYSDESIEEVKNFLASRRAYVGTNGRFMSSIDVDTVKHVMYNLTNTD